MSQYGLKIKNIKAGTLYGYNLGVRSHYNYTGAMFSTSLFSMWIIKHGMTTYKDESTRDLICLDFDFGSRSYEEERAHLIKLIESESDPIKIEQLQSLLLATDAKRDLYDKKSKDEIRALYYRDGVDVEYHTKNGAVTIHYKMIYRNASKAKLGQVMFIKDRLWSRAMDWLTMGLYKKFPTEKAKIVELSAYAPLTTSTITGVLRIPVNDVLIVEDQDSFFRTMAKVVYADGSPKRCFVKDAEVEVKNTLWDGQALIDTEYLALLPNPPETNGMLLLRNHMFKACAFKTRIQQFFKDWCSRTGNNYETYEVKDMFGVSHLLKDVKVITTNNAIKWTKFSSLMGDTLLDAYLYWCNKIRNDGEVWGVVKTDHPSKLGDVQQMSYQMINTLPCSKSEIADIAQTSINYVELLKTDNTEFVRFLRKNANVVNHYEMLAALYDYNPAFADSKFFRTEKRSIINKYVFKLRTGKIAVNGDNLTLCGNPYALLLHTVGEPWESDPTLKPEPGVIQCYTTRFVDGALLCGIRSPHNSPNNCVYLRNVYSGEMHRYFDFSDNIVAVNCIETDIQSRLNGADFDSDFIFTTDDPTLVECAKRCYAYYPTVVNELKESGLTYNKTPEQYALMDSRFAKSQRAIGESSNLAQLAMSYYWTKYANNELDTSEVKDLYDVFVILAVCAQAAIDSIKRVYEIDVLEEIDRIKGMPCMNPTDENGIKKDYPLFMKYTKEIPMTKNGKEIDFSKVVADRQKITNRINKDIVCPMNWLQDCLDRIQGASKTNTIPTEDFFIKMPGRANNRQVTKVVKLSKQYQDFIVANLNRLGDFDFMQEFNETTERFYESISCIRIGSKVTMNRLIELALGLENLRKWKGLNAHRYCTRILSALYKSAPEKFLSNFEPARPINAR